MPATSDDAKSTGPPRTAGMKRPSWWPHFSSPLRSTAVTARLGRVLGIGFGGLLRDRDAEPLPVPPVVAGCPSPPARCRPTGCTQGLHVATGVATIPLLLVKLWSVYPNLFRWPPIRSVKHALERLSVFVLVSSALVQLTTGFLNTLNWYPWPWSFPSTHRYLGYVVIGSVLLHVGDEAARHQVRAAGEAGRGRRADRDPVEREPDGAQQRRHGRAADDAGARPARPARRGRRRRRRHRRHHDRPDRHPAGARRACSPPGRPRRVRRACR